MRLSLSRFAVLSCCVTLASLAHSQVSPSSINFLDVVNGTGPGAQTLTITPGGPDVGGPWTAIPNTLSGGNWLGVQPQSGTGTSTVIVFAVTTGLPAGTYQGQVLVQIGSEPAVIVPVTFNVAPTGLAFQTGPNAANPPSQTLKLSVASGGSFTASWSASVFTYDGANWLSVSPTSGTGSSLSVSVNAAGLAQGTYFGYVSVSGASPPQTPVVFLVSTAASPTVTPSQVTFAATTSVSPASQTLQLTIPSTSSATNWTVAATTASGGNWLTATPASGTGSAAITVAASVTGLAAGSYTGTVTVTFTGTGSTVAPIAIPVTLTVTSASAPSVTPSQLTFTAPGTTDPAAQTLQLTIPSGSSASGWTVSATTTGGGGNWLTATPASGTGSATITVAATIAGLPAGIYAGTVTVTFTGTSSITPIQIPVILSAGTVTIPTVSPTLLTFTAAANATTNPAPQTVQITLPPSLSKLNWSLSPFTFTGGGWFGVSTLSGSGSGSFSVGVSIAGLAPGSYAGVIVISFTGGPAGSVVSPIELPVTLSVGTTVTPTISPAQLSFSAPGSSTPTPQTLQLTLPSSASGVTFNATATTLNGGNWLGVTPQSGTGSNVITVGISLAGLTPGSYSGLVTVTFPGSTVSPVQVPVTLVATLLTLSVAPPSLTFYATATGSNPATQTVNVTVDPSIPNWNAAAVTTTGGNWLTIAPTTGVGNGTIQVTAAVGSLVGQYVGQVLVTSGTESASFTVTFNVATTGISVAPTTLAFTANAGSSPAPQTLTLSSSVSPGTTWQASTTTTTGGSWLTVSPSAGPLPATFQADVNSSTLLPGSYTGTITIADAQASPASLSVAVTLTVNPVATGRLSVQPLSLTLQGVVGVNLTSLPAITISSTATAPQPWAATITTGNGGNWLSMTAISGNTSLQSPAVPQLLVNSSGLAAGVYAGQIAIQFSSQTTQAPLIVSVQLTMTPAGPLLALGKTGVQLSAFAGSNNFVTQSVSIANVGTGTLNWTAAVIQPLPQVTSGPDWLLVETPGGSTGFSATGTATSASPGTLLVVTNAGSLAAGNYYGLIGLTSQGSSASMQYLMVGLTVLPSGPPLNVVYPLSLVFVEGGVLTQNVSVQVGNASVSETVTAASTGTWLAAVPATFSGLTGNVTIGLTNASLSLTPGVYQSVVTIVPSGYSSLAQDVTVYYILQPNSGTVKTTCTPTVLVMALRQLPGNFSYATGQPVGLEVQLFDDCGNSATNATVSANFSNGDPGLTLVNLGNGIYTATWNPVTANTATAVTIQAVQAPLTAATTTVNGAVTANALLPPFVGVGGVVNAASFAPLINVAPGSIVSVFGGNLATSNGNQASFPLPTVLAGIKLSMGGEDLPLFYSGTGQVNAQIPFDLPVNEQASLVARTISGTSESDSVPVGVTLGATQPGIFITSAAPQGAILNVSNQVVDSSNPATAGDVIVIYCTGLGPTAPTVTTGQPSPKSAIVTVPALVTIGGINATVQFAGLSPGFVGLYQVNTVVPKGVTVGPSVPVVITQNGISSNTATIAVH